MQDKYLALLQRRVGSTAVGASTARGMGPAGTIQAARDYLQKLDLARFRVTSEPEFKAELDKATVELQRSLPATARNWGSARKFLNIFLRGCFYNRYLCDHFRLGPLEPWLELPVDSHVAKGLAARPTQSPLPRWKSVIGLTPDQNSTYQRRATEVALSEGVSRVHLDLLFWRPAAK